MTTDSLELSTSRHLAELLNAGRLAEGITASAGAGMGYDGVVVSAADMGCFLYFDTTYGGDDGYSSTLRCYVTLHGEPVDDGWDLPPAPALAADNSANADELVGFISVATRAVVESVLRGHVPESAER